MPNVIKDYYQAELDKAISQIQSWTPDPVLNALNEVQVSTTDKLNVLTSLRQRAQTAQDSINAINYAATAAAAGRGGGSTATPPSSAPAVVASVPTGRWPAAHQGGMTAGAPTGSNW